MSKFDLAVDVGGLRGVVNGKVVTAPRGCYIVEMSVHEPFDAFRVYYEACSHLGIKLPSTEEGEEVDERINDAVEKMRVTVCEALNEALKRESTGVKLCLVPANPD